MEKEKESNGRPCSERHGIQDENSATRYNTIAIDAKVDGFVAPTAGFSACKSVELQEALQFSNPDKSQDASVFPSPKKSIQMLKYRVRNQIKAKEAKEDNDETGDASDDDDYNTTKDGLNLGNPIFDFGFQETPETTKVEDLLEVEDQIEARDQTESENQIGDGDQAKVEDKGHIGDQARTQDKVKIEDHETSDVESFQQAPSITSSCLDALEGAEIVTAKEVTFTKHSAKEVALEDRTLIRPYDDDMTAALIPKGPKHFETKVYGTVEAQRLFRSLGRVPPEHKESILWNAKITTTEPDPFEVRKTPDSQPRGRRRPPPSEIGLPNHDTQPDVAYSPESNKENAPTSEPDSSTLNKTKVTIVPSAPFYPPPPTRPPPPPPKDPKTSLADAPRQTKGFQIIRPPSPVEWPVPRRARATPSASLSPSKKYKELNLRPPIPITPLQNSMHLYGSTSTLPLPNTPEENNNSTPNVSRRRTFFGNHLTVPIPNDNHLRRASYNSPSTHSVRLPMSNGPETQLPQRPGTACGVDRPNSSASMRSSKRERFKNLFKKF
ncbi:hypothetical protein TWF481_008328 [Arthrobotrys musiformis]|uniref:Uncharacterized protein n=1 Tax=Arthrobotrys musiformis TaxID=47236 RepID=A0AAV9W8T7_9PEZI